MDTFLRSVIFPVGPACDASSDWILLVLRIVFGTLLLIHGTQKILGYKTLKTAFHDPIGLGVATSLRLAIFAEFFCSLGVITGLLFRLALIPLIVTMGVAGFIVLRKAPWLQRELPISYFLVFLLLMVAGPGRWSLDYLVCSWL